MPSLTGNLLIPILITDFIAKVVLHLLKHLLNVVTIDVEWPQAPIFTEYHFSLTSQEEVVKSRGLVICELRTANWRTGNMRTNSVNYGSEPRVQCEP